MKEVRPATWIVLGIMLLLIFVPVMFIDVDELQSNLPKGDVHNAPSGPQVPMPPRANQPMNTPQTPPDNTPPENTPPSPPGDGSEVPPEDAPN